MTRSVTTVSYVTDMFGFEAAFDRESAHTFMNHIKHLSAICSAVYVILLFAGRSYMTDRAPSDLRRSLVVWNIALAAFSVFGAVRTVPELVHGIVHNGWTHSICDPAFYGGPTGFWALAFTLSKVHKTTYLNIVSIVHFFTKFVSFKICDINCTHVPYLELVHLSNIESWDGTKLDVNKYSVSKTLV